MSLFVPKLPSEEMRTLAPPRSREEVGTLLGSIRVVSFNSVDGSRWWGQYAPGSTRFNPRVEQLTHGTVLLAGPALYVSAEEMKNFRDP